MSAKTTIASGAGVAMMDMSRPEDLILVFVPADHDPDRSRIRESAVNEDLVRVAPDRPRHRFHYRQYLTSPYLSVPKGNPETPETVQLRIA
jgi:hypothetical protein